MAPGTPIAGESIAPASAPTDVGLYLLEKRQRWSENSKVYTRKFSKKNPRINPLPQSQSQPPPLSNSPPKPSSPADVTPSEPPPADDVASAPQIDDNRLQQQEEDSSYVKIDLSSRSKDEKRELKEKLTEELGQIRALMKKIESCYGTGEDAKENEQSPHSAAPEGNGSGNGSGVIEGIEKGNSMVQDIEKGNSMVENIEKGNSTEDVDKGNSMVEDIEKGETPPPPLPPNYHDVDVNGNDDVMVEEVFEDEEATTSYGHLNGNGNGLIDEGFEKEKTPRYRHLNGNGIGLNEGFDGWAPRYGQLSVSVPPVSNYPILERFEKEKRTPKANQLYHSSDFILIGKDKFPRPELSAGSNKKKSSGNANSNSFLEKKYARAFKSCASLLSRLMKHKFAWVFNKPVDVKGLGLYDYYSIIRHPMDLGTVKSRLNKNWYKSPQEFAEDVRLTFHNAMTYNPRGQDVHIMAQQLSQIFEERWPAIEAECTYVPYVPTPVPKRPAPIDVRMLERLDSMVHPVTMETKTSTPVGRPPVLRQPKPKAKDLYKREMTVEEKRKLSGHLQNLPQEKLDGVVQIIRKRNAALCPQEDEIEIDIDFLDTETLWELDRFVTNYKKSLSKYKRKAELAMLAKAEKERRQERVGELGVLGEPAENKTGEGKENEVPPLPGGGDNKKENATRSSSSSSSSSDSGSSSSDSDSDSSSSSSS